METIEVCECIKLREKMLVRICQRNTLLSISLILEKIKKSSENWNQSSETKVIQELANKYKSDI